MKVAVKNTFTTADVDKIIKILVPKHGITQKKLKYMIYVRYKCKKYVFIFVLFLHCSISDQVYSTIFYLKNVLRSLLCRNYYF